MPPGHLQQIPPPEPLQPERGALPGLPARQQQRPGRILPEAKGKERAVGQFIEDPPLDAVRVQAGEQIEDRFIRIGQANEYPIVVMQALRLIAESLP